MSLPASAAVFTEDSSALHSTAHVCTLALMSLTLQRKTAADIQKTETFYSTTANNIILDAWTEL